MEISLRRVNICYKISVGGENIVKSRIIVKSEIVKSRIDCIRALFAYNAYFVVLRIFTAYFPIFWGNRLQSILDLTICLVSGECIVKSSSDNLHLGGKIEGFAGKYIVRSSTGLWRKYR